MAVTPKQWKHYFALREAGWVMKRAALEAGIGYSTARAKEHGLKDSSGKAWAAAKEPEELPTALDLESLSEVAREALEDIELFARLYFGALIMPWQVEATDLIVELLDTDEEEWVVINCPPGSGKSTFFTKIIPAWLTCKRRHIRGLIGSASMGMAKQYCGELRDILASPVPISQPAEAIKRGYAVQPERCLVTDFGIFKSSDRKWASDAFFVEQHGGAMFGAKEPTWQAFGRGSTFIGARVDFCIWDDLYDPDSYRTEDAKQTLRTWFDQYAETRLEPGGLFVLQGQRLEADDIYRYALDKKAIEFDDDGEEIGSKPKYRHVKFQAHYEDRCTPENHKRTAAPYPEGCLLFPKRLTWPKLRAVQENDAENFEVVYQQNERAPGGVLVEKLWVQGGKGIDSVTGAEVEFPGCWDNDRGLAELPRGLSRPYLSFVTADPSPANFWAIQWWVYHPETQQRFLMDAERKRMGAPDFIDYKLDSRRFEGMMEDWQLRSIQAGAKITHWIVEENAAQRFMLQYDYAKTWLRNNGVTLIPHQTNRNKNDPKIGVTSVGPHWKYGRVRLPGRQHDPGRMKAQYLVSEVTRYRLDGRPTGTDDQVLAEWFGEIRLPEIRRRMLTEKKQKVDTRRPSWAA